MNRAFAWFLSLIDAFQHAEGPPPERLRPFARWALRGSEKAIGVTLVATILAGWSELVAAWFTGWVIDAAAAQGPGAFWATFWPLVLAGAVFFLFVRPVLFAADASVTAVLLGPHLFPLILSRLNRHTLGHSMRYFENDFAGRISQKAMQTARALTDVVIDICDIVFYGLAIFIGTVVVMASVDGRLLFGFIVWGSLYGLALWYFIPRVQWRSAERAGARTVVTGQIVDTLSNIATVKLFAHSDHEDRAALDALETFRQKALRFGTMSATFRFVMMTLGGMLPLFGILGSLYLWTVGDASPGDIAMIAMVATRLSQVTNRIGFAAITIFANLGEIEDGIATLAPPHEIVDRPGAQTEINGPGEVRFEDVDFAYGGKVAALEAFDLRVAPGEKVALVGASGAGKSTAVSLLLRLYDVEDGRILVDGVDVRDVTQEALRRRIAVVRQETAMFNRSAMENIRYGRHDATDAEVMEAARRAAAHDFVRTLEDHRGRTGYAAHLGERGQAFGWATAADCAGPGDLEGRADPGAGRGDQRARQRG